MRLIRAAAAVLFAWLAVGFVGAGSAGAATQAISSPTAAPGVYRYDSSPTSTTHTANARDHALRGEQRPVGTPRSSTSLISPRRAAKAGATLDDLAASAQASARGGQTAAGRALQKHADRAGSIYPKIGSPAERSRVAQEIVEDYLTNPQIRERVRRDGVRIFEMPNGRGVSYNKNGSFRGFLEPYR